MNNYVYTLGENTYINLTNKCPNNCEFCLRRTGDGVKGVRLWLDAEPTGRDVVSAFDALGSVTDGEVVFCGYGEPTENMSALVYAAAEFGSRGYRLRLNTNGLGSAINGRNIVPELKDIRTVSVSLDSFDARSYLEVTHSAFGIKAFDNMLEFAVACKAAGHEVVFTAVDTIGETAVNECMALAEKLGIPLKIRKYIADNYNGD